VHTGKTVLVEGVANAAHPFHLAFTARKIRVVGVTELHPISPLFLSHVAGAIGGTKYLCQCK